MKDSIYFESPIFAERQRSILLVDEGISYCSNSSLKYNLPTVIEPHRSAVLRKRESIHQCSKSVLFD